jgi:hypothetical protein
VQRQNPLHISSKREAVAAQGGGGLAKHLVPGLSVLVENGQSSVLVGTLAPELSEAAHNTTCRHSWLSCTRCCYCCISFCTYESCSALSWGHSGSNSSPPLTYVTAALSVARSVILGMLERSSSLAMIAYCWKKSLSSNLTAVPPEPTAKSVGCLDNNRA